MAMTILKMVRTDGKPGEVRVYERDVAAYQASGWVLADKPVAVPPVPTPEATPSGWYDDEGSETP